MLTEEEKNAGLTGRIIPINIEEQMKSAYIDYSMSVIVSRALPDVRDGMKPVHRRILYDMSAELNLYSDKPTRKSARIVGDVLGKFHPHGDMSVYDAMVRLAQDWSMRYPLVDGQGNFGSMDGDSPAAMRYTEARMKKITDEVMADIDKETVDWTLNFDDTIPEPTVLPTKIPLLIVNGASGIAVGMATNMAPHNLSEVVDACCAYIDNPEITGEELLHYVKGPDFPTGGIIYGYEGVKEAMLTGRGRVMMRAKTDIEHTPSGRECIVITEIPYMINKAEMIKKIADMINDKKIDGISYINDESDRNGLRIIIILKHDAVASVVLNTLFKNTPLQTSFAVNNIALVNGRPQMLPMRDLIKYFIEHRHDVVVRRTRFDKRKAEERLHIVQGLLIAQDNIDEIVRIIRASQTPDAAKQTMIERFELSDIQASAIIEMRLRALTGLERGKLLAERDELEKLIAHLTEVLANVGMQMQIIKDELLEIKEKYGDERRSEIDPSGDPNFNPLDFVPEETMVVTLSREGYIKRQSLTEYRSQRRGGQGKAAAKLKEGDEIDRIITASSHDQALCFSNFGRVYALPIYQIPEGSRTSKGKAIVNLLDIAEGESIMTILPVSRFDESHYVFLATVNGVMKKTSLKEFAVIKRMGKAAITLDDNDSILTAVITDGTQDIMVFGSNGKVLRFDENEVRPMGRTARGVLTMKLPEGHKCVSMFAVHADTNMEVLTVCANGYGKRTEIEAYLRLGEDGQRRPQNRGGKGLKGYNITAKTGRIAGVAIVDDADDIMLIENGEVIAFSMGARMNEQYYDVCFEKAYSAINGAYAMINREFSRMIAEKYPEVRFLNREDDMGSEGLRRAKESYQPTVLLEKYTADWKES